MIAMAESTLATAGMLRPRVRKPYTTATTMNSTEIMAVRRLARLSSLSRSVAGFTAKVPATMEAKAATTRISVR